MVDSRLWVSLFLSVGLHVSLFFLSIGNGIRFEVPRPRLSMVLTGREAGEAMQFPIVSSTSAHKNVLRKPVDDGVVAHKGFATGIQLAVGGDELDETPLPIIDPVVEPEYGFADDVGGAITLSLLVNTEGKVVFDMVGDNDLDEPTTGYLRQQFRALRFRPPTSNGKPVYAWLSYVINIQKKELP